MDKLLNYCGKDTDSGKFLMYIFWFSILISSPFVLIFYRDIMFGIGLWLSSFVLTFAGIIAYMHVIKNKRADKAEKELPDYLLLVANNIRSGIIPEKALIMSAREDFEVLSPEILRVMKSSITGKSLEDLLPKITERIDSELLKNSIYLIVEGSISGGDLPYLLEKTSYDIQNFEELKKDIKSSINTYELFIMGAAILVAPLLLGVSTYIVIIMNTLHSRLNPKSFSMMPSIFHPFQTSLSSTNITMFAIVSIIVITFFGSLAKGLISKGRLIDGVKDFPLFLIISLAVFYIIRILLDTFLGGLVLA